MSASAESNVKNRLVETVTHTTLFGVYAAGIRFLTGLDFKGLGCLAQVDGSGYNIALPTPALVLSAFYFLLATKLFLDHMKQISQLRGLRSIRNSDRIASLLVLLYRDGVVVYAAVLVAWVVNAALIMISYGRFIQGFGVPWINAVYAIGIARLILMLRGEPFSATGVYKVGMEYRVEVGKGHTTSDQPIILTDF